MAMMARMRSLAPWFILTVGGLFVLFMVLSDSKVLEFVGRQSQYVGSIDGEDITYQDFSNLVERARKNQQATTGQDIDESQMDYFRDQVWDALVAQKLMDKKIKDFGIVVTDDEIRDAILGPNPPADLKQQFIDSTGNFNRQLYEQALSDPRNKEVVLMVEDRMRQELIQKKLQDYVFATVNISDAELKSKFIEQNIKMKADYALVDVSTIPDNAVSVTDQDLQKYYEDNLEQYKIEAQRKIKYVLFSKKASEEDSIGVKKNLQAIADKIKTDTASFKSYVSIYSEQPYSKDTVNLTTIPPGARDAIQNAAKGQIVGPVQTYEGYALYKVDNSFPSKDEIVRASHILVPTTGDDKADYQKAMDIYDELIKGADFAATAAAKSTDRGSAVNGGDLGWFGKGQMVKPFEDACYSGKIGVVQKPIKSNFGYHIIKVTGRSNTKYVIEKIVNKIQISGTTQDKIYQDAQDLSYLAKENGLDSESKLMKYRLIETPAFTETAMAIPGLGANKAIVKFAFENGVGTVSDVYKVAAGYAVVVVSEEIKPGFKTFEDVKAPIKNVVTRDKKLAKAMELAGQMRSAVSGGDINAAKTVWGAVKVDSTSEFNTSGNIPGIGREYAFSDYAINANMNEWSQPVQGNKGAYLIKVTYRTKFDPTLFEFQKNAIRKDILQQRKNSYFAQWLQDLKKESDVVDKRYLFYSR